MVQPLFNLYSDSKTQLKKYKGISGNNGVQHTKSWKEKSYWNLNTKIYIGTTIQSLVKKHVQ
jgi:hypothetical protein